jgi:exopolysaccharide biosynthesis predicted pyruvyltransferase EpsI
MPQHSRTHSPTLRTCFEQYRDRPVLMVRPGGNYGDSLIYKGAEHLANDVGLTWRSTDVETFLQTPPSTESVLYLHGGGGYNPFYAGWPLKMMTHALRTHPGPIIQGPQTFDVTPEYLDHVRARLSSVAPTGPVVLYVRERTSFAALTDLLPDSIELRLDHDTALHLDRTDLLNDECRSFRRYPLHAIREDKEKAGEFFQAPTRGAQLDPAHYARSFDHWIRLHACSRSILTNRTHSAILGAILGIPTTVLPNAYHKNRSIWEYSLRSRGVDWEEWPASPKTKSQSSSILRALPGMQRLTNSTKLRNAALSLQGVPRH